MVQQDTVDFARRHPKVAAEIIDLAQECSDETERAFKKMRSKGEI